MNHSTSSNQQTGTLLAGVLMGAGAVILANKDLRNKFKEKITAIKEKSQEETKNLSNRISRNGKNAIGNSLPLDTSPEQINPTNLL